MKKALIVASSIVFVAICNSANANDKQNIVTLIKDFHNRTTNELFCRNINWDIDKTVESNFRVYFTQSLFSIYRETCTTLSLHVDPRFGDSPFESNNHDDYIRRHRHIYGMKINQINIRMNTAVVRVAFRYNLSNVRHFNSFITYRLQKEGGAWKIDDMKTGGDELRCEALYCYESLREDLKDKLSEIEEKRRK